MLLVFFGGLLGSWLLDDYRFRRCLWLAWLLFFILNLIDYLDFRGWDIQGLLFKQLFVFCLLLLDISFELFPPFMYSSFFLFH